MSRAPVPDVVQVIAYYPPRLGGMERVAQVLAEHLAERLQVEVLTTDGGPVEAGTEQVSPRLRVRRFAALEVAHTPVAPGLLARLAALPRRTIVHVHVGQAVLPEMVWLTRALRRAPYIAHFHLDVDASGPIGRLLPIYKRFVLGPVLRRAAAVIVLSPEQRDLVVERYRVDPGRVAIIPNGVDPAFTAIAQQRAPVPADRPLRVLFVGRLESQKNVHRLLDALALVRAPLEVRLVGDGELRPELEARAAELDLVGVEFAGPRYGADLEADYAWADVFVLTSDKEGMPLVLLEAMAAGLAIVATDVSGTRELVGDTGLLAEPEPAAVAAALDLVAIDRELLGKLGARSAERGTTFGWEGRVAQLHEVYARLGGGAR
ncbi:Glycosyltransferase involved in cell wall bisynthesis [Pseudonocardia thermophila]|uniref:Glycosyltransferase involved in cell wall bisynthesis n=1 Tax=Pseudonocardia thermophila TaxID=1848 RepID=A0A1M6YTZ0_PSETH|nr:glycosyltransferase family 4 protein [Pseudonocardia thermophila]SHL21781.1 Glycosyltransferase involved in cell wall bisynthesis [Pseudonocardia thermophila]